MDFLPLKKKPNYFVHKAGFVSKIENGREVECARTITPKSKRVIVWLDKTHQKDLLLLLLEYFFPDYNPDHKITYNPTIDLKIPIAGIEIKRYSGSRTELPDSDLKILQEYKCNIKAAAANYRHKKKITGYDVLTVLKADNFQCVYCGCGLQPYNWHLDHFHSLSQGGDNVLQNLAPSCGGCNIMKSSLDGYAFVHKCLMVVLNNKLEIRSRISSQDRNKIHELYIENENFL